MSYITYVIILGIYCFFLCLRVYRDFYIIIFISSNSCGFYLLMFLDINAWRCQIGMFAGNSKFITTNKKSLGNFNTYFSSKLFLFLLFLYTLQFKFTYTASIYFFVTRSLSVDIIFLIIFQKFLALKLLLRC